MNYFVTYFFFNLIKLINLLLYSRFLLVIYFIHISVYMSIPISQFVFLKQIVTGDEKWILYNNVEWKRLWGKQNEPPQTTPKASLHPKKVMLYIWWNWKGVLYYELLLENQTINSNKYYSQLDQLKVVLDEKHPELVNRKCIIFHQDNATPHVSLMTRQKLLQLGWEVLIHPPYSPDIAPSDFHLFQSLQNSLSGKNFNSLEDCKRHLGASLVAQWFRIHLPIQGTQVRALVWEDPTCHGATKPVCYNY